MSQEKSSHKFTDEYKLPKSDQVAPIATDLENEKHTELNESPRETQQNATQNDMNVKSKKQRKRMRRQPSDAQKDNYLNDSEYPDTNMPVINSLREPKVEDIKEYQFQI
jgi:hypothetical protein